MNTNGIHPQTADDLDHAVVSGEGRRHTDYGQRNAPLTAERRFGRRLIGSEVPTSPMPRQRNERGEAQPRSYPFEHPLPAEGTLRASYSNALNLIEKYFPLRSARLEDYIERAEAALRRCRTTAKEQEELHQNRNEEISRSNRKLTEEITRLRDRRDQINREMEKTIKELVAERTVYRTERAEAYAQAGLSLPDDEPDDDEILNAATEHNEAAPPQEQSASTASESSAKSSLMSNVLRSTQASISQLLRRPTAPAETPPVAAPVEEPLRLVLPKMPEVPFPIDEARAQAEPEASIAIRQGVLSESPAYTYNESSGFVHGVIRTMKTMALIVCGLLFGFSVGIIAGQIKMTRLQNLQSAQMAWAAGFCLLGIFLFWTFGRVVGGLASLIAEKRYTALLARHPDNPQEVGKWFTSACALITAISAICLFVLVTIEATVEIQGLVKFVEDQNAIRNLTANSGAPASLSVFAKLGLALMFSIPFALMHAADGYISGRRDAIRIYLSGRREQEAFQIATILHEERKAEARQHLNEQITLIRTDFVEEKARRAEERLKQQQKEQERNNYIASERESRFDTVTEVAPTAPLSAESDASAPVSSDIPRPKPAPSSEGQTHRVRLAKLEQQCREAWAVVRETRGRRNTLLNEFDRQIAEKEAARLEEEKELPVEAKQLIEDAYMNFLGSVKQFDELYQKEMGRAERYLRGGWVHRMRAWATRKLPENEEQLLRNGGKQNSRS
jgi:hypothetical protein